MINLDKNYKYVVACSFGPDSMALLDMLIKENFDVIVAHVNYHKRKESYFEENSLRKYCLDRKIPCEILDTTGLKCDKNFQEWAREIRYKFFKNVLEKYNAKAVLVAHQQDDLIETYLMQKARKNIVKTPGIAEKSTIFGVNIIRPLLGYSKQELLDYDKKNSVPFSIDVSNLTNDYERNKIRHEVVEKLTKQERENIINEIKNAEKPDVVFKRSLNVEEFLSLKDSEMTLMISSFIEENSDHIDISKKFIDEIRKAFKSDKANVQIKLTDKLFISKEYDEVFFVNEESVISYKYVLNKSDKVNDDLFEIDFSHGAEDRNIFDKDYPITIKPVDKSDSLLVKDYECEVRRLFIDWKLPHHLRNSWPGIYNKEGKLIYVPRYRKDFVENHSSKFVIKFVK